MHQHRIVQYVPNTYVIVDQIQITVQFVQIGARKSHVASIRNYNIYIRHILYIQYNAYKDEMLLHIQRVFAVAADRHYCYLNAANEGKSRTTVLSVLVQEADNLEAKDANGK